MSKEYFDRILHIVEDCVRRGDFETAREYREILFNQAK